MTTSASARAASPTREVPNPGGDRPTGTYKAKTGAFTLEWSSPIVGGSFDGVIGVGHLEGTFQK